MIVDALLFLLCVALGIVIGALLIRCSRLNAEMLAAQADADRLHRAVDGNLRAIRAKVGYGFPEAVAVCDAIASTLQPRCRVDSETLERRLILLRRAHNTMLLESSKSGDLAAFARVAMPWAKENIEAMQKAANDQKGQS